MIWIKSFFCLYFLALLLRQIKPCRFVFGTWGGVAMGVATVASAAISTYGGSKGGKGGAGGGGIDMEELPSFWSDPYLGKTQDYMYDYGTNLLAGNPNEYYKPLGEVGGSMFEDYLSKVTRDTTKATEEGAIRRGMAHGGAVDSAITKNVSDVSSKMRWEDFLRAMEGRSNFLKIGTNQVQQVGANSLTNQSQKNQFELEKVRLALGLSNAGTIAGGNAGQAQGNAIGSTVQTVAGVAGDVDWSKLISMMGSNNASPTASPSSNDISSGLLWEQNQGRGRYNIG